MTTDEGLPTGIDLVDLADPAWEHELRGPHGEWERMLPPVTSDGKPDAVERQAVIQALARSSVPPEDLAGLRSIDTASLPRQVPGSYDLGRIRLSRRMADAITPDELDAAQRDLVHEIGHHVYRAKVRARPVMEAWAENYADEHVSGSAPSFYDDLARTGKKPSEWVDIYRQARRSPATELAAWEHEARDAHGEWVKMGGGGWEGRDRALEEWFHPQQLDASTVPHPVTGYAIKTGKELRVSRPPETSHGNESLGAEGPPTFDVYDHPGLDRSKGMFPVKTGTEPIRHVYRGVSETEWQQAQQRGYLQSDARGTISSLEGTNAAVDPSSAVSYLPGEGHSRVLKIEVRPEDKWFTIRADSYLRTRQRVPVDRVVAVSPPIRKFGKYDELQVQQLTTEMASPVTSDTTFSGAVSILRQLQGKDGIAAQVTDLGWHDAWMHEPRGPHGEWVKGTDYAGTVGRKDHITRIEEGHLPIEAVAGLHGVEGEVPGQHRTRTGAEWEAFKADIAANGVQRPIFITVDHGEPPKISEGNERRDAAVAAGLKSIPVEIRYFGHAEQQGTVLDRAQEPTSPYNFKGPFAKSDALKQIESWYNRNRSGTDVLIGLLNAYSALQANDFVGAAMHLRTAAREAEARTKGPSRAAANYLRMADQMESRHRMITLLPGKMAAIVTTAAPRVLEMIGGGRQKWDGQVHVFVQADDPSVAGSMSWDGRMRIADQSAEEITKHADSFEPWLPGHADSVPLHEIIHGIVGPEGKDADQAAYRTKAGATAEEGFTELGTAMHMPGYLDAIGHGHRETAIIAVNDAGRIREVFNRQAMFEFQDEFRVIERMQGSSQVRGTGSMTAYNALGDARYELFRPEVDVAKMTGHLAQAAQSTPDPEVRARILALMQKLNVADTETKHVTVSEYADRLADPERIANGQAWGAYAWQTRNALQWVQGITDAEGYMSRGKGTDGWQRVIQLADEINQTGPAGKFDVMARQILRSEHIEPDVGEGWLVGRLSENIAQLWPTEASQDAASLVPRLRTIAQTLVSEYRRRLAEKYGANA